jgi:hypothetical protein
MQTSKIFLAIGASLLLSLSVRGDDNDAQAKARQALEQQLNQPHSQPAPPPTPAPTPAPPPAKKVPAAPAPQPEAATSAPAPEAVSQADDQTITKAREAMRQKINDLATETPPAAPAAPPTTEAKAPTPPPATPVPAPVPPPKVVPPPAETGNTATAGSDTEASPEAIAKARSALRQKVAELPADQPEPGAADEAAVAKARAAMYDRMQQLPPYAESAQVGKSSMQFPPLEGPEMPISGAKVQRLHGLLQQYKADQITPEQYQAARAKILAEP